MKKRGYHLTEETIQKLRRPKPWMKNNLHRVGKLHSEESKRKISEGLIKRWPNKSERKRKSIAMQGNKNHLGFKHSEESKRKMSLTKQAKRLQQQNGN